MPEAKLVMTTYFPGGNTVMEMRFQPTDDGTRVTITQLARVGKSSTVAGKAVRSCSKLALTSFQGRSSLELFRAHQETDDPTGFQPPHEITFGDVRATLINRSDLSDDVAGINSSLDMILQTGPPRQDTQAESLRAVQSPFPDGQNGQRPNPANCHDRH